jgi:hypothetical protein
MTVASFAMAASSTTSSGSIVYPNAAVGGVSIDAEGLLNNATTDEIGSLKKLRLENLETIPSALNQTTPIRKVSLRRLEEAINECIKAKKPLPDAIVCLAGLQHIEYVFVYPEEHDIVLVGPGEGWTIDSHGDVVGITTHRPVMQLDDLLVALRTAQAAAQGGISCSIDPTAEGLASLKGYFNTQKTIHENIVPEIEKAMGHQNITVNGVPSTSHFAKILVAADYRMKRVSMELDPSPVRGLPSYLQMLPATGKACHTPRFWLEPQFASLLRDSEGLAWALHGSSVKAVTEEDFLTATGNLQHSGKASPAAQKWCDIMTRKYPELAVADPVFGQLQNCMELAVVGALVAKERLTEKSGNSLPLLMESPDVQLLQFTAPKQVDSKASVFKKGHNWVASVSGGVAINSWMVADAAKTSDSVAPVRKEATPPKTNDWWWN